VSFAPEIAFGAALRPSPLLKCSSTPEGNGAKKTNASAEDRCWRVHFSSHGRGHHSDSKGGPV